MESQFNPGQEVTLRGGSRGVLYARLCTLGQRRQPERSPSWFFIPDTCAAVGLVIMSQPHPVAEHEIASAGPIRAGTWPAPDYRLDTMMRQRVYVAAMQGQSLPVPEQAADDEAQPAWKAAARPAHCRR